MDGHLSVGAAARRVIGDIKRTLKVLSPDTIQLVSARDDGPDASDDGETVPADSYQDPCKQACKLAELWQLLLVNLNLT